MEKKGLKRNKLGLPLIIFIVGLMVFTYIKLSYHRYSYDEYVDQRLRSAANAIGLITPESLIDSAFINKDVEILMYDSIQKLSNNIAEDNNVIYVYVMVKRGDSAFFVLSSFVEQDISNDLVTRYMDPYEDATEKMLSAFGSDKKEIFDVTIDVWGHFRSIYLPRTTEKGTEYILCADVRSNEIVKQQWNYLLEMVLSGLFLLIIALPLIISIRKIIVVSHSEELT
ncbi:MAG: hypothetical protein JXR53_02870 [Bacteroidales bacterium]|nr:hypothetical protein [Bacteroidales bacterium]